MPGNLHRRRVANPAIAQRLEPLPAAPLLGVTLRVKHAGAGPSHSASQKMAAVHRVPPESKLIACA